MSNCKLLCLYQVMFQYRVGTYEAISRLPDVDFELWHGTTVPGTKLKNYEGAVSFRHRELPTINVALPVNGRKAIQPYSPFLFLRLVRYHPDVILAEGASSLIWASVAFLYAKCFRKKIIWWSFGALKGKKYLGVRALAQKWISFIERHVDAVFTYSSQGAAYFLSVGVPPERIFKAINVVCMQPKLDEIRKAGHQEKKPGFNIAYVGAITSDKKLDVLVDAAGILGSRHPDIHLHIIGDGPYQQELEAYAATAAADVDICFHGPASSGLNVLLASFQVFVLPGLGGLAIVDGMLSSLPVISGQADGTELDLISAESGFVTDNMTTEYLVDKLSLLYDDPDLAVRMGKCAFDRITGAFSFENYMRILASCIEYVVS